MKSHESVIANKLERLNQLREDAPKKVIDWIISMRNLGLDVVVGPFAVGKETMEGHIAWQQRDENRPWGLYWHPTGEHPGPVIPVDANTPLWIQRLILANLGAFEEAIVAAIDTQIHTFPQTAEIDPEFVPPEGGLGRPEKT